MNEFENLLEKFQSALLPEAGGSGISAYVSYIIQYAYILAAILMVILVGTKVVAYFANPTKEIDPYILVKPILILMALGLYQPLVNLLLFKPTGIITDITEDAAFHVTNSNNQGEFSTTFFNVMLNLPKEGEDSDISIYDIIGTYHILEVIHLCLYLVAACVAAYIMVRQLISKVVYFVMGVFVLPLSLIPGNEEILKKWFFGFLAVLLWIPVLRIIQTILIIIHEVDIEKVLLGAGIIKTLFSVILQFVMIFFILQVPKYANLLVSGSGDSDSSGWLFFFGREAYYEAKSRSKEKPDKENQSASNNRRQGK